MVFNETRCDHWLILFLTVLGGFKKSLTTANLSYGNNHILRGTTYYLERSGGISAAIPPDWLKGIIFSSVEPLQQRPYNVLFPVFDIQTGFDKALSEV